MSKNNKIKNIDSTKIIHRSLWYKVNVALPKLRKSSKLGPLAKAKTTAFGTLVTNLDSKVPVFSHIYLAKH